MALTKTKLYMNLAVIHCAELIYLVFVGPTQSNLSYICRTYTKNYRNLAGQLDYDINYVRHLDMQPNPVEALLQDFITSKNATKEALYQALVDMERQDVADRLWLALASAWTMTETVSIVELNY